MKKKKNEDKIIYNKLNNFFRFCFNTVMFIILILFFFKDYNTFIIFIFFNKK